MVLIGLASVGIALIATPAAGVIATRAGLLDRPGHLKTQRAPVPYLGGLAVFLAGGIGAVAGRPALAIPGALALALGTADDATDLPAGFRLACEGGIGLSAGAVVPVASGPAGLVGTAAIVVVVINALNMVDGIDGLAAGVALMSAGGFAILLHGSNQLLALGLAGGLVGFLWYNRPPARIYLGDGGAYLIGTWLAVLAAAAWRPPLALRDGASGGLLLAFPILELLAAVVRRLRSGQQLFAGDRDHIYDQLIARGWSPTRTGAVCTAVQAALVAGGLAVARTSTPFAAIADGVTLIGLLLVAGSTGFLTPTSVRRTR